MTPKPITTNALFTHLSISLMRYRLEQMFPGITFDVIGEPKDLGAEGSLN